jgi:nucleotide-binding universal stress UspA family protein
MTGVIQPAGGTSAPEGGIAIRHILWPCDFSTGSVEALRWALPLARAFGSEVTALHVIPTTLPARGGPLALANPALLQPHLHHEATAALDRFAGTAIAASVPTRVALREGKAAHHILEMAGQLPADLIVQGTRGMGAFDRAVIGSVAEAVIGRARCPVLTVPMEGRPPSDAIVPGTVLCATDFSAHATRALDYAAALAGRSGVDLLLVHVVEPGPDADEASVREAERRLTHAAAATGRGGHARTIVVPGVPAEQILRLARERQAGLVVMGTHGSRTLRSMVFGSTARRVVRDAPCAALTVRAG